MDSEEQVTKRDRYHARAQLVAAIIGALIAGLLGGREWKERTSDRDIAARDEFVKQLQAELAERTNAVKQLSSRIDAQEEEIKRLQTVPVEVPRQVPLLVQGQTPPERTEPEPSNPVTPIIQKEEAGIAFQVQRCRQSGSEVTCELLITNRQADRRLYLCASCGGRTESRIVDVQGNEYRPTIASLGAGSSRTPRATLASGVPIKGSITFGGVQPTSGLKLLEVGFLIERSAIDSYQVQFHDVRVE